MVQKIDTSAVESAANRIQSAGAAINSAFQKVSRQGSRLAGSWQSRAGSQAESTLYKLAKFNEDRDAVLQNYVDFLKLVVEQGYLSVEETNTSLASYFK